MSDPIRYTPAELASNAMASLENHRRYAEQSRNTRAGQRAELTPRERLQAIRYEREQSPVDCSEGFRMKYGSAHGAS
jgi:hypothetical protein